MENAVLIVIAINFFWCFQHFVCSFICVTSAFSALTLLVGRPMKN